MTKENAVATVMFADIVGSTDLYDKLGDEKARESISQSFSAMTKVIVRHGGIVIKTIGDEIMCRFTGAADAARAGREIQETFRSLAAPVAVPITIRIGFHHGPVILDSDDVFGDAVNIAARMAGVARPEQIITTEDTVGAFDNDTDISVRRFDRVRVKGKREAMTLYEVLWTQENLTQIFSTEFPTVVGNPPKVLHVTCGKQEKELNLQSTPLLLGRNHECDLVVSTQRASRIHARIEPRRGKFILLDTSTNGTYARTADGRELYLRREELVLLGETTISLGSPIERAGDDLIHLHLEGGA
jgi:class 3 adenylate cyclase